MTLVGETSIYYGKRAYPIGQVYETDERISRLSKFTSYEHKIIGVVDCVITNVTLLNVTKRREECISIVTIDGKEISVSKDQRLLKNNDNAHSEWVSADRLFVGDKVEVAEGTSLRAEEIAQKNYIGTEETYGVVLSGDYNTFIANWFLCLTERKK